MAVGGWPSAAGMSVSRWEMVDALFSRPGMGSGHQRPRCRTPLELVTVEDRAIGIGGPQGISRAGSWIRNRIALVLALVIADAHEQPVGPALVLGGITQATDVAPDRKERPLRGILGQVVITQDAEGHAVQARMARDHERLRRRLVALHRTSHEDLVHDLSLGGGPSGSRPPDGKGARQGLPFHLRGMVTTPHHGRRARVLRWSGSLRCGLRAGRSG